MEDFPGQVETQRRLRVALEGPGTDDETLARLLETDLGFGLAALRAAGRTVSPGGGRAGSMPEVVDDLGPQGLRSLVESTRTVDVFTRDASWGHEAVTYRSHVAAVQAAIHRIAGVVDGVEVEALMTAALLHDVGKLALRRAHAGYVESAVPDVGSPEQRLSGERRTIGVDHALVGGVLARRWGLSPDLTRLVERHHSDDVDGSVATLRLADMLAHHGCGDVVSPQALTGVARSVGIDGSDLRSLLFDQAMAWPVRSVRRTPCPLSTRELEVLRLLAKGQVYKQIASNLGLATSTVRTHLHNIYVKLEAVDRARAVLIAVDRGWI